ncbi:hypothetical protein P389DRAFT_194700 [Cystobasidium minutum MCA 4210]|uniref:uncharacterized protein n=1 Tax=Cystobasidium minutum MCA 4210 TaxID=1397322 RepID=UPI0034CF3F1D|eukprot:jgi/Rhomi1/194700/gm1.2914_g
MALQTPSLTATMRPSTAAMGGHMPSGHRYTGWWGASGGPMQKGVTQYTLSHFRQNPLQGAFKHSLFQGFSRIVQQTPYFLLPFVVAYGTISWAVKKNEWYNSKEGHLATAEHDE